MRFVNGKFWLGLVLLLLSMIFYTLHYLIFGDLHHIFLYLVGDTAFVFIEVFLVTLVIQGALEDRAKKDRLEKMNMTIGAFFSEVGRTLLIQLSLHDQEIARWQSELDRQQMTLDQEYTNIVQFLRHHDYPISINKLEWPGIKEYLLSKREFMLRLLENANLHEHEDFTDLLWAVFHLTEELEARRELEILPDTDYAHLDADSNRVYRLLIRQWLQHMEHLKSSYPHLFSLALRVNPFNRNGSAVVTVK